MKNPLNYSLGDQKIPEANCCKYLGIIIPSDLCKADRVNYTVQKAWRALHFVMRAVKRGNKNTKILVTSTSHSRIWGGVLGYIQGMSARCFRPCTKYGCEICASFGRFRMGIFGAAQEDSMHACVLQGVCWRQGVESDRG